MSDNLRYLLYALGLTVGSMTAATAMCATPAPAAQSKAAVASQQRETILCQAIDGAIEAADFSGSNGLCNGSCNARCC